MQHPRRLLSTALVLCLGLAVSGQVGHASAEQRATNQDAATYIVQPHDTLSGIALQTGTTVAALVALNHLSNPNLLSVGQVLSVGSAATASQAGTTAVAAVSQGSTYTIQAGDTLFTI